MLATIGIATMSSGMACPDAVATKMVRKIDQTAISSSEASQAKVQAIAKRLGGGL